MENVIKVQFFNPVDGQSEYYFGSIAAIFERFSADQLGCTIESMWAYKLTSERPKITKKCTISKHTIVRKPQNNPKTTPRPL